MHQRSHPDGCRVRQHKSAERRQEALHATAVRFVLAFDIRSVSWASTCGALTRRLVHPTMPTKNHWSLWSFCSQLLLALKKNTREEASLWLNEKSQNGSVAKGWLSTLCCWEAGVHTHGPMVVWLRDWPQDRRVAGSIPETTNFLANISGQATNALVSLFTKQYELVPASYGLGVRH